MNLEQLLSQSIATVVNYLEEVYECGILLLENETHFQLRSSVVVNDKGAFYPSEPSPIGDWYLPKLAIQSREKVYIPIIKVHPFVNEQMKQLVDEGIQTVCYFPLISGSQIVGVLYLHLAEGQKQIDEEEVAICQSIALQVSLAVKNAQLFKAEREQLILAQKQSKELQILNELASVTSKTLDIDDLLSKTTQLIQHFISADIFCFVLFNDNTDALEIHPAAFGIHQDPRELKIPLENSIVGQVYTTGQTFVSGNVLEEDIYFEFNSKTKSELTVPLVVQKLVIGAINLESFHYDAFDQNDVDFIVTLAAQVASTIERTKLYEAINNQAMSLADQVMLQTNNLKQERDRTVAILESAGEGILITDTDDLIMYANPALEKLTGYSKDELYQTKALLLYSAKTPSYILKEVEATISSGQAWSGEMVNSRKDGTQYDVSMTMTPILDHGNRITGFVTVLFKIFHELKRLNGSKPSLSIMCHTS